MNREEQIEEYNKCVEEYNQYRKANEESYDSALVIFLTSTFGFSFLAISYIGKEWEAVCHPLLLKAGWIILFLITLLFLANFWVGGKALNKYLEKMRQRYQIEDTEDTKEGEWANVVRNINLFVGFLFIIAIGLITTFVVLNL